tara:strand:- start:826 stop:1029 length:204 start_codon:yes stop_codon:yes gene_type:complete
MTHTERHTAKHFFDQFIEPYRSQALANIQDMDDEPIYETADRALSESFDWDLSPEGMEYWDTYCAGI